MFFLFLQHLQLFILDICKHRAFGRRSRPLLAMAHSLHFLQQADASSRPSCLYCNFLHCSLCSRARQHDCRRSLRNGEPISARRAYESISFREKKKKLDVHAGTLQDLQIRSKGNECWRKALLSVVDTCRDLSEDRRVQFAVALANCHLAASALPVTPCTTSMSIAECTTPLTTNPMAFNTYTEVSFFFFFESNALPFSQFYLAIDSMCYSLQREEIQSRMETAAAELLDAGTRTSSAIEQVAGQLGTVGTCDDDDDVVVVWCNRINRGALAFSFL